MSPFSYSPRPLCKESQQVWDSLSKSQKYGETMSSFQLIDLSKSKILTRASIPSFLNNSKFLDHQSLVMNPKAKTSVRIDNWSKSPLLDIEFYYDSIKGKKPQVVSSVELNLIDLCCFSFNSTLKANSSLSPLTKTNKPLTGYLAGIASKELQNIMGPEWYKAGLSGRGSRKNILTTAFHLLYHMKSRLYSTEEQEQALVKFKDIVKSNPAAIDFLQSQFHSPSTLISSNIDVFIGNKPTTSLFQSNPISSESNYNVAKAMEVFTTDISSHYKGQQSQFATHFLFTLLSDFKGVHPYQAISLVKPLIPLVFSLGKDRNKICGELRSFLNKIKKSVTGYCPANPLFSTDYIYSDSDLQLLHKNDQKNYKNYLRSDQSQGFIPEASASCFLVNIAHIFLKWASENKTRLTKSQFNTQCNQIYQDISFLCEKSAMPLHPKSISELSKHVSLLRETLNNAYSKSNSKIIPHHKSDLTFSNITLKPVTNSNDVINLGCKHNTFMVPFFSSYETFFFTGTYKDKPLTFIRSDKKNIFLCDHKVPPHIKKGFSQALSTQNQPIPEFSNTVYVFKAIPPDTIKKILSSQTLREQEKTIKKLPIVSIFGCKKTPKAMTNFIASFDNKPEFLIREKYKISNHPLPKSLTSTELLELTNQIPNYLSLESVHLGVESEPDPLLKKRLFNRWIPIEHLSTHFKFKHSSKLGYKEDILSGKYSHILGEITPDNTPYNTLGYSLPTISTRFNKSQKRKNSLESPF